MLCINSCKIDVDNVRCKKTGVVFIIVILKISQMTMRSSKKNFESSFIQKNDDDDISIEN